MLNLPNIQEDVSLTTRERTMVVSQIRATLFMDTEIFHTENLSLFGESQDCSRKEIILKEESQAVEKRRKSRTLWLKKEDVSKQGRKIEDLDADAEELTLVNLET
ncbi:hypothetical protein Tco_0757253 [Tanacetum coccineum]